MTNAQQSTSRVIAWMVWIIASIFYGYQYILRVMPNIMLDDIMQQFNIDAATMGQFSGVYYIGYSLMHLPIGILLDRFGPRKVMSACILLSVVGIAPLMFAEHWAYPIVGRLILGIGSSAAILGLFKIVRMSFSEKYFTRMLSLAVTIGLIGAIYGGAPLSYMREVYGYQAVVKLFALAGIGLALATYLIVPDQKSQNQEKVIANIKEVLSNGKVICCCLFAGMMVGPLEGFADVWSTVFLKHVYGFDASLSASLPSMIFIGMCFGSPVLSMIAEKAGNHLTTIIAAGLVMALIFSGLVISHFSIGILTFSFVLVGVCCSYQILAIYKASTYARAEVAGLTTAVANMIIMIFGYGFHSIMGWVINFMGGPSESHALVAGVAVIPIALAIGTAGFVVLAILPEKASEPLAALSS
jgi:predicted MFS family arabinose efflux permease